MNLIDDPNLVFYLPLYQRDGSPLMSADAYGHSGTVNGALWRPDGRYFDGVDDVITFPDHATYRFGLTDFSIVFWVNFSQFRDEQTLMKHYSGSLGYFIIDGYGNPVLYLQNGSKALYLQLGTSFNTDEWHFCGWAVDRAENKIVGYTDGTQVGNSNTSGGFDTATDITAAQSLKLGERRAAVGGFYFFNGCFGEVLLFGRRLSPPEMQRIYLATGWRYR